MKSRFFFNVDMIGRFLSKFKLFGEFCLEKVSIFVKDLNFDMKFSFSKIELSLQIWLDCRFSYNFKLSDKFRHKNGFFSKIELSLQFGPISK